MFKIMRNCKTNQNTDVQVGSTDCSKCSCLECDSIKCFEIRRALHSDECTCEFCKQSLTCLYRSNKNVHEQRANLECLVEKRSIVTNQEAVIEKPFESVDCQSYHRIVKSRDRNCDKMIETKFNHTTSYLNGKRLTETSKSRERQYTRIHNATVAFACQDVDNTTAKLSAQIMDVTLDDFNDSISLPCNKTTTDTKQDIFARIKEIYKACSCKICECIPVKSFLSNLENSNNFCSCKPCDCDECKMDFKSEVFIRKKPHIGCPCIRCDRKDCRGIVKEAMNQITSCDCKPCDCLKCSESFSKPCSCIPCQCIDCKSAGMHIARTLTIAPVEESIQRRTCNCNPCECSNCTHNYNTTGNLHDRSVGTVTHNSCPCETCINNRCSSGTNCRCETQNGIMRKPIQRDQHDYDVRRVQINNNWPTLSKYNERSQPDIIAMYANVFSNTDIKRTNSCNCIECECVLCEAKLDNIMFDRKPCKYSYSNINIPRKIYQACSCNPCDCSICPKYSEDIKKSKCTCQICDCIDCEDTNTNEHRIENGTHNYNLTTPNIKDCNFTDNYCKCKSCLCVNCLKMSETHNAAIDVSRTSENFIRCDKFKSDSRGQAPSKPFLREMTKDVTSKEFRPTKQTKKLTNISLYSALSHYTLCCDQDLHSLDNFDSDSYFSVKNSNFSCIPDENAHTSNINKELVISSCNRLYCVASLLKDISLFTNNDSGGKDGQQAWSKLSQCERNPDIETHNGNNLKTRSKLFFKSDKDYITENNPSSSKARMSKKLKIKDGIWNIKNTNCIMNLGSTKDYNFDYNKIQNTLREAQSFSKKLNKILDTYENANKNFVSVTQNLKHHYDSISLIISDNNCTETICNQNNRIQNDPEIVSFCARDDKHKLLKDSCNMNSSRKLSESNSMESLNSDDTTLKPILGSHNLLDNLSGVNILCKSLSEPENDGMQGCFNGNTKIENNLKKMNCARNDNVCLDVSCKSNGHYKPTSESLYRSKILQTTKQLIALRSLQRKEFTDSFTETDLANDNFKIKVTSTSTSMICDLLTLKEDKSLNTIVSSMYNDADFYKDIFTDVNDLISVTVSENTKDDDNVTKDNTEKGSVKENAETVFRVSCDVTKKNLYLKSEQKQNCKTLSTSPLIELNMKRAIGMISHEIRKDSKFQEARFKKVETRGESSCRHEMIEDIKHCLNRLASKAVLRSELNTIKRTLTQGNAKSILEKNESFRSDDGLKVSFLNLRRVSDHTVFVKWNIPKLISEVRGYELQVEGRVVQQIVNPTRTMAVVTCLPHAERVLLSIKTITTTFSEHYPTATTLYHPRQK